MTEPDWPAIELIQRIHDRYLGEFGGFPGIRDAGVLESAAWRARWRFSMGGATLAQCAAAYAFAFATSHAFHDGNKRTAFYVADTFLELNGHELIVADETAARDVMIAVAMRQMSEDDLAAWFAARIRSRAK